jgi:hypothetical protein
MSAHNFSCSGGTGTDSTKIVKGHIMLNFCFASGGICTSCSAFVASGARNVDALFFMLGWDQYGFDKKCFRTRWVKLVFFCIRRDLQVT